jgi:hypothetical protein
MEQHNNISTSPLPQTDAFILIEAGLHPHKAQQILLRGKFRLPCGQDGVPEEATQVFKHIVMVTTRSANYQSLTPFRDVIVFEDDVQKEGDFCSGIFNINVMDHIQFDGEGDYYLLCSVGTYTSNIVKVSVA